MYDPKKPSREKISKVLDEFSKNTVKIGPYRLRKDGKKFSLLHTDGIGTKGVLHHKMETFGAAAIDACAMNINDMLLTGLKPKSLVDHIMIEREDNDAVGTIVEAVGNVCRYYDIHLDGGETAIMDNIEGLEIGVALYGTGREGDVVIPRIKKGDVVIGLRSSGLHSNGFSFVRKILFEDNEMSLDDKFEDTTLGRELTKATMIYEGPVRKVLKHYRKSVHGMVHLTGGAYTKIKDFIGENVDVIIDKPIKPQPIFELLHEKSGYSSEEMYERFNCGTGFLLFVDRKKAVEIRKKLRNNLFNHSIVGEVVKGSGEVRISSSFEEGKEVVF